VTGKDYEDWGGYPTSAQSYPLKDLAEAVVRLGSPVIYDRAGAVALMESFEFGLGRWNVALAGVGVAPVLSANYFCSQGHAVVMDPGSGGAGASKIDHFMPVLPAGLWGMSIRFNVHTLHDWIGLSLSHNNGVDRLTYSLTVNLIDGIVTVLDSGGLDVTVLTIDIPEDHQNLFHFVKLVCDPENELVKRVSFDNQVAANLDVTAYNGGPSSYQYLNPAVIVTGDGAVDAEIYLDDVIVTYNESD
jgi:hypothetical protein